MSELTGITSEGIKESAVRKTGMRIIMALQHLIAMFGSTVLIFQ